ncbi:MAG: 6-bladed beta-propeller [Candidatus Aminicenantales bacterium]
MRKFTAMILGFGLIAVAFPAARAQKIRMVNGVEVVTNGKKPSPQPGQPAAWQLVEELTLGLSENPDEAFSEASTFIVDKGGNILVLDSKEKKIKVFDSVGKFLRTIGKPGQGPGEIEMPAGIQMTAGGELMVEDAITKRLSFFKPSGEFVTFLSFADKMGLVNIALDSRGNFLGREIGFSGEKMFFEIKKYDAQLKPLFTVDRIEFPVPLPGSGTKINLMSLSSVYQFDGVGNIFYGRNVAYEIKVFSPEGKHVRSIQKDYDRVKITQADIDEILERAGSMSIPGVNVKEMFEFPDYFPPFQFFVLDEEGRMLVRTFKKGKVKNEYEVDVFDVKGRFVAQFISKADIRVWQGDKLYGIEETEEGFRVIKRYRLASGSLP